MAKPSTTDKTVKKVIAATRGDDIVTGELTFADGLKVFFKQVGSLDLDAEFFGNGKKARRVRSDSPRLRTVHAIVKALQESRG